MKRPLVFLVIVIVILGGLFILLQPKKAAEETKKDTDVLLSPTKQVPKVFELKVEKRKLVSGPETLQVNQGDNLVIKLTVDEDEELHLHGYNKHIDLEKNRQGELSFKANLSGRFVYELENSKTEIGALEVQPK